MYKLQTEIWKQCGNTNPHVRIPQPLTIAVITTCLTSNLHLELSLNPQMAIWRHQERPRCPRCTKMSPLSRSKTQVSPHKHSGIWLHTPHTLRGVIWAGEELFSVTVTELCSSLSGHAHGFPRPPHMPEVPNPGCWATGRQTRNIFKTLRNLIKSSKCESGSKGG